MKKSAASIGSTSTTTKMSCTNDDGLDSFVSWQSNITLLVNNATSSPLTPAKLTDCIDKNGNVDAKLHRRLLLEQDEWFVMQQSGFAAAMTRHLAVDDVAGDDMFEPKAKKPRREKAVVWRTDEEGVRRVLPPTKSAWCNMCVAHPNVGSGRFQQRFRKRFRMPYESYLLLVNQTKGNELFDRSAPGKTDAVGNPVAPISLLILSALRCLGRGWTFDDLSENTAISEEVLRVFFHKFLDWGSTVLFRSCVQAPINLETAKAQEHEFRLAGMPGCIGSMDATHVALEKCAFRLRQVHLAAKLPYASRTCNIVVNHRRRILSTTQGHPARWNDKTIVKFDRFVMALRRGEVLQDLVFELCDYNNNNDVIRRKCKGAWLLVDNGCHRWSATVPPTKATTKRTEIRFSQWLESMRKDVECTFGVLKGRWRVLKSGIRLCGLKEADKMWKTCCALHNLLLEVDGLDDLWADGVAPEWQQGMGEHDADGRNHIPQSIRRLLSPAQARNCDASAMGRGNDFERGTDQQQQQLAVDNNTAETDSEGCIIVRKMSLQAFRNKLITHFNIAFQRKEIKWPKRNGLIRVDI